MKAFVLAAGYGTRLGGITEARPKPLVPVAGIPFICYSLALLKEAGIGHVVCNLHYRGNDIVSFFRRNGNFGFTVEFSEEKEILGTGGGLKKCEGLLNGGAFVLINSDIITDLNLKQMISCSENSGIDNCISVHSPGAHGAATVSVTEGRVADFKNSLGSGIPPAYDYMGAALLSPSVFPLLSSGFSSVVYSAYTGLAERGLLKYYEHGGLWMDVGTVESLKLAEEKLSGEASGIKKKVLDILGGIRE